MAKKPRASLASRRVNPSLVREGMLQRVREQTSVSGTVKSPAVPALLDDYVDICARCFAAAGRPFTGGELATARALIAERLAEAFEGSPRSKIAINFHAEPAHPLGYEVLAEVSTIADAYARWVGTTEAPLFGAHADARVLNLAETLAPGAAILDLGAGTGRNALALARRGHRVDAVEITPDFAEILRDAASREELAVRVVMADVFRDDSALARDYGLFVASELVPDFRGTAELRALFELAARVLGEGGSFVLNLHLAVQGYTPERSAREFAQQCYSALFTVSEVAAAAAGLPLEFVSDDSVHDYERAGLPEGAWPPTPWFVNWVTGRDVYDLEREQSPVELRWLVFRKTSSPAPLTLPNQRRLRRLDSNELRQGLVRRLKERTVSSGVLTFPAVPALRDVFAEQSFALFEAVGREVSAAQRSHGLALFDTILREAFAASQRSNIVVTFEAAMGSELEYGLSSDAVPLAEAYTEWQRNSKQPLFGSYPDARLLALLGELGSSHALSVLDIGAGLGRNALALARLGHRVAALEPNPTFAERLREQAASEALPLRVVAATLADVADRDCATELGGDYELVLASGLCGDLRSLAELRSLFVLAAAKLKPGARLLLNVHVARDTYAPDAAAREWAQQSSALFFTSAELAEASAGLLLELSSNDAAHEFEAKNLPENAWPPTPAFSEWALAQHMFALPASDCPIELRWLVWRKRALI